MAYNKNYQPGKSAGTMDYPGDEVKIDFKGMKFEYEFELAIARRVFITSWLQGTDMMSNAIQGIEYHIIDEWKDDEYKKDVENANKALQTADRECYDEEGRNTDQYNAFVILNIMARWKAINQLLYRRNMAPQIAEQGVIG